MTPRDLDQEHAALKQAFIESLSREELLAGLSPEQRLAGLTSQELLAGLSADQIFNALTPEQRSYFEDYFRREAQQSSADSNV